MILKPEKQDFSRKGILAVAVFCLSLFILGTFLFIRAAQVAAVRSNVKDILHWSSAISAYISEHGTVPANPHGILHPKQPLVRELIPFLKYIRVNDRWGGMFHIWTGPGNRIYGIETESSNDFIIASYGARGNLGAWNISKKTDAFYALNNHSAFQNDIVCFNGRIIHGPHFSRPDREETGR